VNGQILSQLAPGATTLTDLYTVGDGLFANVSALFVCNRDSGAATFRIAIRSGGRPIDNKHYIYYDVPLPGNTTFMADFSAAGSLEEPSSYGITLNATDVVSVYASTANLSFSMCGKGAGA
jgi:hypothetical protein